jgi:aminopeptidase N
MTEGVANLTQAEAAERAALVAVHGYDIDMDLTGLPEGPQVRCRSVVRFSATPGAETFVDCCADVVEGTLNGEPLPPAVDGRIALTGLAAENVLDISTVQADTTAGPGVHKAVDPSDKQVYLWTTFVPDFARYVYACFDQPDLKAPHTYCVIAPADWTVLSNSGDPVVTDEGQARRWSFPPTPPLATYDPVVLAGPFYGVRREVDGYDLGFYARASLKALVDRDADDIFEVTAQGLAFFGDKFGMPFPQRTYDQVFIPEFGGAMENYGCVAFTDSLLFRSTPTVAQQHALARVVLHEMAHMWFGNIVTMRWWDDIWLNESFAEFAANWASSRATDQEDSWVSHLAGWKLDAYAADQGPTTHPICSEVPTAADAMSVFDAITYPKGASVLRQLMEYVGEDNFVAGMKAYFARHAWGNTTLTDLTDALAEASGRDLDAWRSLWLDVSGVDRMELDGTTLVAPGDRPHIVAVGYYRDAGETFERIDLQRVEVAAPRTDLDVPAGTDLVLLNDEDLTFATTRPGDVQVIREAGKLPTPIARAVAVAAGVDMLFQGELAARDLVASLVGVLAVETLDSVIEPYLARAVTTAILWSAHEDREALLAQVAKACERLTDDPTHRLGAYRSWAQVASPADLDRLAAVGRELEDFDLQWKVLARRAELGDYPADEVTALRAVDPNPDSGDSELIVMAAAPDPARKAMAWDRVVEEQGVSMATMARVLESFWRPDEDQLLQPYGERYLQDMPNFARAGMMQAMNLSAAALPMFGIDEEYLDRVEQTAENTPPVVRKAVIERADTCRRMLRARRL